MENNEETTTEPIETNKGETGALFRSPDFRRLFIPGMISDIGTFFTFIAIMFLALEITDNLDEKAAAQVIGLIMVFMIIPNLIIGPFSGAIVDRLDRKSVMVVADLIGAITSFGLVYVALVSRTMWHIYLFASFSTVVRLFFYPARGAALPLIVDDPELLVSANSIMQSFAQLARVIGPALAGFTIAAFGLETAFVIDGVSFLVSAFLISTIQTNVKVESEGEFSAVQIIKDLGEGVRLIKKDQVILYILVLFTIGLLAIGFIDPLFVPFLSFEFGMGEKDFGLILTVSSTVGLLGAVLLMARGQIKSKLTLITFAFYVLGFSMIILGGSPDFPQSIMWLYVGMAIISLTNVLVGIPINALIQTIVPNEHLGKVNGFMSVSISLAQVTGALFAAFLAGFIEIKIIYITVGGFSLLIGTGGFVALRVFKLEAEAQGREVEAIARMQQLKAEQELLKVQEELLYPTPGESAPDPSPAAS
ncbi:MAG: MFS transporter [Candidatus Kariarchaeaceae archaeon]|jgi:MFS family permease